MNDSAIYQVDEITKKFTKSADDMCKAKEKEISLSWALNLCKLFRLGYSSFGLLILGYDWIVKFSSCFLVLFWLAP